MGNTDIMNIEEGATGRTHASNIPLTRRAAAYLAILTGYFFYCYSFLLPGYVRPHLIEEYGHSLGQTASITVAQNVGMTFGSMILAVFIARLGRRSAAAIILLGIAALTAANAMQTSPWSWILIRGGIAVLLGGYYVCAVTLMVALFPLKYRAKLVAINSAMFAAAEISLGGLAFALGETGWVMLIWAATLPVALVGVALLFFVPDDRKLIGFGEEATVQADTDQAEKTNGWQEMFSARYRRLTITCLLVAGANFTGYQLFTEFVTLYLKQVREFTAEEVGIAFSLIGTGSLMGGLFWAFLADRFGRKIPLVGFVGVAIFISLFLTVRDHANTINLLGFGYGFCLACTYHWGVWFTEIFPVKLRPYGASLFPAGHFISLFAPLIITVISTRFGITTGMGVAPVIFLLAVFLGMTLPETLQRKCEGRDHAVD